MSTEPHYSAFRAGAGRRGRLVTIKRVGADSAGRRRTPLRVSATPSQPSERHPGIAGTGAGPRPAAPAGGAAKTEGNTGRSGGDGGRFGGCRSGGGDQGSGGQRGGPARAARNVAGELPGQTGGGGGGGGGSGGAGACGGSADGGGKWRGRVVRRKREGGRIRRRVKDYMCRAQLPRHKVLTAPGARLLITGWPGQPGESFGESLRRDAVLVR